MLLLISDAGSFMTGSVVTVDGRSSRFAIVMTHTRDTAVRLPG